MLLPNRCSARAHTSRIAPSTQHTHRRNHVPPTCPHAPIPLPHFANRVCVRPPRARESSACANVRNVLRFLPKYVPAAPITKGTFVPNKVPKRGIYVPLSVPAHVPTPGTFFSIRRNKSGNIDFILPRTGTKCSRRRNIKWKDISCFPHLFPLLFLDMFPIFFPSIGTFCSDLFRKKTRARGNIKRNKVFNRDI